MKKRSFLGSFYLKANLNHIESQSQHYSPLEKLSPLNQPNDDLNL